MKRHTAGWKQRFWINDYTRLVLFCFAIVSLPVVILGLFSYFKSSGMVLANVSREKQLHITQMQSNVEQLLKTVERSSTHFLGSPTLKAAYYEPLLPHQFDIYNAVKSELSHLQTLDSGISDITLLSREGNWIINNYGLNRLNEWAGSAPALQLYEASGSSEWLITPAAGGQPSAPGACVNEVQYIKKLPLTAYDPTGMFMVTIPTCNLKRAFALDRETESMLILDAGARVIVKEGTLDPDIEERVRQAITTERSAGSSGQLQVTLDQRKYAITYRLSDYNGWAYVSVVTLNQLAKQAQEIGWFTLSLCITVLALFSLISWRWSRRLYLPVLNLYNLAARHSKEQPQGQRVSELHYIGEQLQGLIYTKTELEGRLHGHMEQVRTLFTVRLFQGQLKEVEIARQLKSLGLQHLAGCPAYAVLALQIRNLDSTRFSAQDYHLLMFAVGNMVEELVPAGRRLYPILLGSSQMTLIASEEEDPEAFARELMELAEQIRSAVQRYLGITVSLGISRPFKQWNQVPRASEEGQEALRHGFRLHDRQIHYFGDLGEDHNLHYSFPQVVEMELFEAIKQVDREAVGRWLAAFMEEVFPGPSGPADPYPFALNRLLIDLLGLMQTLGIKTERTGDEQHSLFDELFQLGTPRDAEAWFRAVILEPMLERIQDRTESRHQLLTQQMVRMVHEEFETDLSIDVCAERLHYNAKYLGAIFRKEMDQPFGGYLLQHRHQMAKTWLVETDMTVKEISERLRYNNSQNFIRSFRKLEGITPGKYKELHSAEGSMET